MPQSSEDVHRLVLHGREIILVGTAHVSAESVALVQSVIRDEKPDHICVELDQGRLESLSSPDRWKSLDLRQVIRTKQLPTLLVNLMLSSAQKRMGLQTGSKPGAELLAAVEEARSQQIPFTLVDREVKSTLRRAWASTPWYRKFSLIASLFESLFDHSEVSETQLREIRQKDTLGALMEEFGKAYPELRRVLIDERDQYLAKNIANAPGAKIVAVVGAGHVSGMRRILEEDIETPSLESLCQVPPPNPIWSWLGWSIPIAIVASVGIIAYKFGWAEAGQNALYWAAVTGIPAAVGTALALAHPLAILAALLLAPLTTLHPLIGIGMVTASIQAWLRPPRIYEMETITEDIMVWKRWWTNRVTRILLAFVLPGLPTTLGTFFGGWKIFQTLQQ